MLREVGLQDQLSLARPYHMAVDPRVVSVCWIAVVTLYLGYPDQALVKSREALALARKLSHPFTLAGIF